MRMGQGVLAPVLDTGALDAAVTRLEVGVLSEAAAHAALLRDVLELHRVLSSAGAGLSTVAHVALTRQVSELAAGGLLAKAELLAGLPGAVEAVECGLLTVEQSTALVGVLGPCSDEVRLAVWSRLQQRLIASVDDRTVLPPARLKEQLTAWVIAADPQAAAARREVAEAAGDVEHRRRDDGLVDIFLNGAPALLAQAALQRIRELSAPFGSEDARSAGKRRLDAALDLLLGRGTLPLPGCCPLDSPAPCGTEVVVLVPLGAALGTTDELASLVGHGPLDPGQLASVLHSAPRLRPAWVAEDGTPVATGSIVETPAPGPAGAQEALLRLAALPPPDTRHPRHPDDHQPADAALAAAPPLPPSPSPLLMPPPRPLRPALLAHPHPAGTSGPYVVRGRLRTLLTLRSPRCEWPGCGASARRCDIDHDLPWPAGATCGCNCGPLCRRHHRIKQYGILKQRTADGIRWTDPTGRIRLSPSQLPAPQQPVRALPAIPVQPDHCLSPAELRELAAPEDIDPIRYELRVEDIDPDEPADDLLQHRIHTDTGWGLSLDDPYRWSA